MPSLQDYPFFTGLSETELAQISARLSKRVYGKGAYLYHSGNSAVNAYLVESGLVRLFFPDKQGNEYLVELLVPRSLVGLPMLYADQARKLGAAAVQSTVVLALSQKDLAYFAQCFPQLTRNIYRAMDQALRTLLEALEINVVLDLPGRLAFMILHLSRLDNTLDAKNEFIIPLSQTEMASWLGASRGHFNRTMLRLQQLGIVRIEEQKLTILDRPGLLRLTEGILTE